MTTKPEHAAEPFPTPAEWQKTIQFMQGRGDDFRNRYDKPTTVKMAFLRWISRHLEASGLWLRDYAGYEDSEVNPKYWH